MGKHTKKKSSCLFFISTEQKREKIITKRNNLQKQF